MGKSTRFPVAIHILSVLAMEDRQLTSEHLANSADTNPVVIRRLVSALREANLVTTQAGSGGGAILAVDPANITLWDIHEAVETPEDNVSYEKPQNESCICARNLQPILEDLHHDIEVLIKQKLTEITLADIIQNIRDQELKRSIAY
jgi:Rrf2 family protein